MVSLNFAHICEYAFLLENKSPGIIGVFSNIETSKVPLLVPHITVIVNIKPNDTNPHKLLMTVKSPSEKEVLKPLQKEVGPVESADKNFGLIINIANLKLEEEGIYNFDIFIDGKKLTNLFFRLQIKK